MSDNAALPADDAGLDSSLNGWNLRPWALAAMLALAGLLIHFASDGGEDVPWRMALTAALVFGSGAAAFTLSPERWKSSALFAGLVALVMAGIAWRATSAGDHYADEGFWVFSGMLAVTLALPLFQADFHRLRWSTSYKDTHFHVWTDAITGAGAFAFVGLSWALIYLLSELFRAIQIDLLHDLIDQEWFGWVFSGAAFGAALGVLRNQLKIIGTLQNVVLLVLSILAVPLAIALVLFLLAVILSGLDVLWEATQSATPLLLAIAVGCFVLTNAVVRDDDETASNSRVLRIAGFVLALGILPLAAMAALSMGTRIGQHGLSPERLWALVAIAVAVAYGVAYFASAIRGRKEGWRGYLRQSNLHLAVLTCAIALILALPIFNFGSISASNQLARLESGAVSVEDFDYAALKFDFGDAGREALAELEASEDAEIARLASEAAMLEHRPYGLRIAERREIAEQADLSGFDEPTAEAIRAYLRDEIRLCREACRAVLLREDDEGQLIALLSDNEWGARFILLNVEPGSAKAVPQRINRGQLEGQNSGGIERPAYEGEVELRPFEGQQLYIDGEPAGEPFN
ncbi:DUF4153 domain-containing protein [uncultured Erythrobacter sp.]|uniref:DUF4153 domain-containing protein n=1 Tax=uncultured Erythrobacter sp. TaxID=263913 RepID=UPI00262A0D72|nr:DUF4153 domain-containing protein [uncultured Erythrobacter sp.]